MISDILAFAGERWPRWFSEEAPLVIEPVILAGGPAHQGRGIVFLLPKGERWPRAVVKIALCEPETAYLRSEIQALRAVWRSVPPGIRATIPRPLDLRENDGFVLIATAALQGRRLVVPDLTTWGSAIGHQLLGSFLRRSFRWSTHLGQSTVIGCPKVLDSENTAEAFARAFPQHSSAMDRIASFVTSVRAAGIAWTACWQHGDPMVGNVLDDRGVLRFVDWEHGRPASEPWFDVAYAPGALAILAREQGAFRSISEAAIVGLSERRWTGRVLRREMSREWSHPLPLSWAVSLTSMETAVRQSRAGRRGAQSWADLTCALIAHQEVRTELPWLAPQW